MGLRILSLQKKVWGIWCKVMKSFLEYLKKIWKVPALFCLMLAIGAGVLALYDISCEPVLYCAILCGAAGLAFLFWDYSKYHVRVKTLERIKKDLPESLEFLEEPLDKKEALYMEILEEVEGQRRKTETERRKFYEELSDYYSMWVHQIKTPIAALRLLLAEPEGVNQAALDELFKVERYVEMVLGYLRTEEISSDMTFTKCSLDEIVREQIHKYARIFVGKRLALSYDGTEFEALTDPKWLGFVIGQILSNALKYTEKGKISIYLSQEKEELVIEDTGIGIREEDLPRVFEKGYTGHNGRRENTSTGIGLYLCAKIMKKLGHTIRIESAPGKGTRVFLGLGRKEAEIY